MPYGGLSFPTSFDSNVPIPASESARLGGQRLEETKWFLANVFGIPDGQTLNGSQHWLLQFADLFADFVITGLLGSVPVNSLTMTIPTGSAYVTGRRMVAPVAGFANTYAINSDTYVDIDRYGNATYTAVGNGALAPAVAANSIRTQKVVTNGTQITAVTDLRTLVPLWSLGDPSANGGNNQLATKHYVDTVSPVPSGSVALFFQAAAPTGWTQVVTHNDKALRIVSGAGGGAHGSTAMSTVFGAGLTTGSHALTIAELAAHTHTTGPHTHTLNGGDFIGLSQGALNGNVDFGVGNKYSTVLPQTDSGGGGGVSSSTGGGAGHTHTLNMDLQYIDVILCSRN